MTQASDDIQYANPEGLRHRSDFVIHGGTVYLAGIMPADSSVDIAAQTRNVLDRIDQQLALAGTDKSRLLSATIWLTDLANLKAFNAVWSEWVVPGRGPARACVQAVLQGDGLLEIAVIAAA